MSYILVNKQYYCKRKKNDEVLSCTQGCFSLLILFSDCLSVAILFPFIKIPKSVTQSSPLLEENRIDKN